MSIEWSTSGLDLHLDWNRGRGVALADAIRAAVRDGRLAAGTRLPSTRALAADLGVARGTVTRAYAQLTVEGYLVGRQGAGTVVADLPRPTRPEPVATNWTPTPPARPWNLRPGRPDLGLFPQAQWLAATRKALSTMPTAELDYGDPLGNRALRTALADYLGRARGVVADPDRLMICGGYLHALALLAMALRQRGVDGPVVFEDPSMPDFRDVVAEVGLACAAVPVDEHGIQVAELARHRPAAVVVTAAHQFPMGVPLHPRRRSALVEFARGSGALVIEDDYDGEFRFDRQPVGALQAMAPELVVYAGTASKTLAPGVRLSWLVLPAWLVEPMRRVGHLFGRHPSVIDQLALAELITSGGYDQQVRRARTRYRRRRDRILGVLDGLGGGLTPAGIAAGLHLVVLLGPGQTEAAVLARAARHGLSIDGLGRHWWAPDRPGQPAGVVIGYAAPAEHAFGPALRALRAVLSEDSADPVTEV